MFRQYRKLEEGEFIVAGGDCSQGGSDKNCTQFLSKTKLDIPLIYHSHGVAATQTSAIHPVLEKIADFTGVKPVVGLERNNGGASEMERLKVLNRDGKYKLFVMPKLGNEYDKVKDTNRLGFDTTGLSRPIICGDGKSIIDLHGIGIYDEPTVNELAVFINGKTGKPEAAKGAHDDTVMALLIAWFIAQRETPNNLNTYTDNLPQFQNVIDIDLGI